MWASMVEIFSQFLGGSHCCRLGKRLEKSYFEITRHLLSRVLVRQNGKVYLRINQPKNPGIVVKMMRLLRPAKNAGLAKTAPHE